MKVLRNVVDTGYYWLGEQPAEWTVVRGKDLFRKVSLPVREQDEVVTCFRDGVTTLRKNRREDGFTFALKEIGYQGVRAGHLVVHAMDAFAGAIGIADSDGKCSPVYSVCAPRYQSKTYLPYYAWALRNMATAGYIQSVAKGIRERSTDFRFSEVEEAHFALPSLDEQRRIAVWLDLQTNRIDKRLDLLGKKRELLSKLRSAVVREAVTAKVLWDVDTGQANQLPQGWEMVRIKDISKLKSGDFISAEKIEASGTFPVFGGNGLRGFANTYNCEGEFALIGRQGALCGNVNFANGKFWATEHAVVVRPKRKLATQWLGEMLRCMNLNQYATASAQPGLSVEGIVNKFLPLPTLTDQHNVVDRLNRELPPIDKQIVLIDRLEALLKKQRKALIHEAVTGKIDLSTYEPPAQAA